MEEKGGEKGEDKIGETTREGEEGEKGEKEGRRGKRDGERKRVSVRDGESIAYIYIYI